MFRETLVLTTGISGSRTCCARERLLARWCTTLEARLALTVVDLMELLERAGHPVGVHELLVIERRAAVLDRLGQVSEIARCSRRISMVESDSDSRS